MAVEGNWLVINSPLFAPFADIALLFLPLVYLQAHTKSPSTEKSVFYPQESYKQETLTFWKLENAAFPILFCVSVWEAPKAEMALMGSPFISLLPNNLIN